jgi:hypothetical protein
MLDDAPDTLHAKKLRGWPAGAGEWLMSGGNRPMPTEPLINRRMNGSAWLALLLLSVLGRMRQSV